jgi:tetratricopeptide (TPR) repeat protein
MVGLELRGQFSKLCPQTGLEAFSTLHSKNKCVSENVYLQIAASDLLIARIQSDNGSASHGELRCGHFTAGVVLLWLRSESLRYRKHAFTILPQCLWLPQPLAVAGRYSRQTQQVGRAQMNRKVADQSVPAKRLLPFSRHISYFLLLMAFGILGPGLSAHSQSVPPPDPELDSAKALMSAFEKALQANRSDPAAKKGEVAAAVKYSLAEKREHREQAGLWLLLRAQYWVPDDPDLLVDLGVQEDDLKLFVDADIALTEALRIRPNNLNALYTAARVKMDLGQMQSAEQAWLTYIKHDSSNPAAYYGYGAVLQTLGRNDEARREFQQSIEENPNQAESYYRLGELARHEGNKTEARMQYQEAIARDSMHGGALTGLGILNYEEKKYDQAERELEDAIKSVPDYRTARYYRGLTLAKMGRQKEAQAELSLAMQLSEKKEQQRQLVPQPYRPY